MGKHKRGGKHKSVKEEEHQDHGCKRGNGLNKLYRDVMSKELQMWVEKNQI